jgi:hypothetical protein
VTSCQESNAVVVLTGLGLALMAALVAYLASLGGSAEDGEQLLDQSYSVSAWPFGLGIHSAATLPLGEQVLRLTVAGDTPEAPLEPANGAPGAPATADGPIVWWKLAVGSPGQPPREAALVWYPKEMAASVLEQAFGSLPAASPEDLKQAGGPVVVRSERVPWGELEVPLVHERRFGPGARFHDSVRVNISTAGETCLLYVMWDAGLPGSVELAREVLAAIRPR